MHIRPMTREDLPQVTEITFQTFKDDEMYSYLQPNMSKYPDDARRTMMIRLRARLVGVGQSGLVAVTDEGDTNWNGQSEIAGYAYYVRLGDDEGAKRWKTDTLYKKLERKLLAWDLWYESKFLDRTTDPSRFGAYLKLAPWNAFNDVGPRWHLSIIGVSPQHQRRGIGGMLVKRGQNLAREEGLPLTLESSIAGRGLYAKMGFKIVGGIKIFDGFTDALMLWEPEEMRGKWLEDTGNGEAKMKAEGKANSRMKPVSQIATVED